MKYRATKGARFGDKDAEAIGRELARMGTACTAEQIVTEAKRKASPLHSYFEWNNDTAAHKHRLEQARYYVRHIEVIIVTAGVETQTRGWHHVAIEHKAADENGTAYVSAVAIRKDRYLGEQVIKGALRELEGWQRRYAQYAEVFGEVFVAIPKAKKRIAKKGKRQQMQAV